MVKKLYTILLFLVLKIFLYISQQSNIYNTCLHDLFFRKQVKKALSCNHDKMTATKSLLNPQSCGFVKAFLSEKSCQKSSHKEILESYKRTFGDKENMNIDISEIMRRLESIKKLI